MNEALIDPGTPAPAAAGAGAWPLPPRMRLVDKAAPKREPALLTLAGGAKVLGTLRLLDVEGRRVEFQPESGPLLRLAFGEVRSVNLTRSVTLLDTPVVVPSDGVLRKPRAAGQRCTIHLRDGAVVEASVVATVRDSAGLFLYVAHYGDTVLRWFLPAEAVLRYELAGEKAPPPLAQTPTVLQAANLSEYFGRAGAQNREELEGALLRAKTPQRRTLGELLLQDRLVTPEQLAQAQRQNEADPKLGVGDLLVRMGALSADALRQVLVSQLGVPCVSLARFQYDPNAVKLLPAELARKHMVMPLYRTPRRMVVAIEDPLSWQALRELEFATGLKMDPVLASREELEAAVGHFYGASRGSEKVTELLARLEQSAPALPQPDLQPVTESDSTLVRLVNKMIVDAHEQGASDIHIESAAEDRPSRVRLRVDGVLRHYIDVPPNFRQALVARIKIMASLDISERRRPQDGRIRFEEFGPLKLELRVVVMPTAKGLEDIVLRLLSAPRALSIDQIGLAERDLGEMKSLLTRNAGLVLVCGPTGSGKTTTLHSMLAHLNNDQRKIYTVEDPVEITQEGVSQVQVNEKLGLTFPAVLRSFLRGDPDVIMVGETRDAETAQTVLSASLTGHLVLTTMHTKSAVESVVRLMDLGLDAFNFSDALLGVVGQRLVRRLCDCKQHRAATDEEIRTLAREYCRETGQDPAAVVAGWRERWGAADGTLSLHHPVGCPACEHTGYKGRAAVYELVLMTPQLKAAIQRRATPEELLRIAVAHGTTTLEQDAIEKIWRGDFDYQQVLASCR